MPARALHLCVKSRDTVLCPCALEEVTEADELICFIVAKDIEKAFFMSLFSAILSTTAFLSLHD